MKISLTRRHVLSGIGAAVGGVVLRSARTLAANDGEILRGAEAIHMEPVFHAGKKRVYDALTNAAQFNRIVQLSAATKSGKVQGKAPATISREVGGAFSMFDGFIVGRQLELVPGERIVQAWRVAYWKPGEFSIARFQLVARGADTQIVFDHGGFPKGDAVSLAEGWHGNYWEPLAKFLAETK